ncbi:acyltransferase domain-containing protein [Enterococcus faecium]|uniref:acyltransferase domain-containing protein n=1 Tax=Enterococcus faecium TaxID=1352 RepID=UPI000A34D881|nr:acyltransferase domain-containing protein [Enterococcus faecium]
MEEIVYQIKNLAGDLDFPEAVIEQMMLEIESISSEVLEQYSRELLDANKAKAAAKKIDEVYEEEPFVALTIYLYAASQSWLKIYQPLKIPRTVYLATMNAFTRFIHEHFQVTGKYRFDRGFWIWRYTSGLIFRIGELEYERTYFPKGHKELKLEGKQCLSLHIPSDADLSRNKIRDSYESAIRFFELYFPDYHYQVMYTDTWLLSPNLTKWLKQDSKIRLFAADYRLLSVDEQDNSGVPWIFGRVDAQVQDYPEKTSLQRQAKQQLLAGAHIGSALGILSL